MFRFNFQTAKAYNGMMFYAIWSIAISLSKYRYVYIYVYLCIYPIVLMYTHMTI
jgi:hypothetical protein